jgi:hypothetical protein
MRTSLRKRARAASLILARPRNFSRHGLIEDEIVSTVDLARASVADQAENSISSGQHGASRKAAFLDRTDGGGFVEDGLGLRVLSILVRRRAAGTDTSPHAPRPRTWGRGALETAT